MTWSDAKSAAVEAELRRYVEEGAKRLVRLLELRAPAPILVHEAARLKERIDMMFPECAAEYRRSEIEAEAVRKLGLCINEDCTATADEEDWCLPCYKKEREIAKEEDAEEAEWLASLTPEQRTEWDSELEELAEQ